MISPARQAAMSALLEISQTGKFAQLALSRAFHRTSLTARDKALATEIVYGTLQRQRSIDVLLQPHCRRDLGELDPIVLTILRMTAYQLTFLTRVPPYAALNDGVELCKRSAVKASGFVNGVLRAFTRVETPPLEQLMMRADRESVWAEAMALLHSYPTWLVAAWERELGRTVTERILKACNEPPTMSVRVNELRWDRHSVLTEIQEQVDPQAELSLIAPAGLRLSRGMDIEHWDMYLQGKVTVQDEGSMLIAPLLQPRPGQHLLDMCAGLGTKATQLAECAGEGEGIDVCDIHPYKLKKLKEACARLGVTMGRWLLSDARSLVYRTELREAYDGILLDAPCSGLGVLRRRPDIRWRRTETDVASLAELQSQLLSAALSLVRPGGIVVYATCTLLRAENSDVVREVVRAGLAKQESIQSDLPALVHETCAESHDELLLTPDIFGTDGFYMTRLRKL